MLPTQGSVLQDRYQLERVLGRNPMRQTWLATDQTTGEAVVIKLLEFGSSMQWQDYTLFQREAQVLQQLDHPHIPQYRDYFSGGAESGWFAIVQTYIPGISLKDHLDQGRKFREAEIRSIAIQILEILCYLHQLSPPVLHRDIKPSNLVVKDPPQPLDSPEQANLSDPTPAIVQPTDLEIYLVDFGAAQIQAPVEGRTFTVVGTYGYTPIEQFGGRAVSASDLYALGCTLVHLATGVAPSDLPQQELRIHFSHLLSLDPNLIGWLERMTEPSVERRFRSAQQALTLLNQKGSLSVFAAQKQQPEGSLIQVSRSPDELCFEIPNTIQRWIQSDQYPVLTWVLNQLGSSLKRMIPPTWLSNLTLIWQIIQGRLPAQDKIMNLLGLGGAILLLLFLTSPVLGMLLIPMLVGLSIICILGSHTHIRLDLTTIEIEHRIFDWTYQIQRVLFADIKDLFRERAGISQDKHLNQSRPCRSFGMGASDRMFRSAPQSTSKRPDAIQYYFRIVINTEDGSEVYLAEGLTTEEVAWIHREVEDWIRFRA